MYDVFKVLRILPGICHMLYDFFDDDDYNESDCMFSLNPFSSLNNPMQ